MRAWNLSCCCGVAIGLLPSLFQVVIADVLPIYPVIRSAAQKITGGHTKTSRIYVASRKFPNGPISLWLFGCRWIRRTGGSGALRSRSGELFRQYFRALASGMATACDGTHPEAYRPDQ